MTAIEQFANNPTTSLNGIINSSTTSIVVNSATGFPSSAQYRILIGAELMLVTGGAGTTTWTVTRGAEGTTAASHGNGSNVTMPITAGAVTTFIRGGTGADFSNQCQYGSVGSVPSSAQSGILYFTTDSLYVYRDNGSSLLPWGLIYPITLPVNSTFSSVNLQSTGTVTTTYGGVWLYDTGGQGNTDQVQARIVSNSSSTYTATMGFQPLFNWNVGSYNAGGSGGPSAGICLRNSSSGKLITYNFIPVASNGNYHMTVLQWTNPSTFSTTPANIPVAAINPTMCWLQIIDDNTNRYYKHSTDGFYWAEFYRETKTTFLGSPPQDGIGFYFNNYGQSSGYTGGIKVLHWNIQ